MVSLNLFPIIVIILVILINFSNGDEDEEHNNKKNDIDNDNKDSAQTRIVNGVPCQERPDIKTTFMISLRMLMGGASPPQQRPPQYRPPQQRPPQHRPPQHRPPQQRPPQHRPPQQRPPQQRPPQQPPPHLRPPPPPQQPPPYLRPPPPPPYQRPPQQRPPQQPPPYLRPPPLPQQPPPHLRPPSQYPYNPYNPYYPYNSRYPYYQQQQQQQKQYHGHQFYQHICGSSLISEIWLLTAAHCLKLTQLYAVPALIINHKNYRGHASKVKREIPHPKYSRNTVQYDIGLILLETPIKIKGVEYVQLPSKALETYDELANICKPIKVMGLGQLHQSSKIFPKKLMCVDLHCMRFSKCKRLLKRYLSEPNRLDNCYPFYGSLCAEPTAQAFFKGDSGGPCMCGGVQYGIVSWGAGGGGIYPSMMTRTDVFVEDFIMPTIRQFRQFRSSGNAEKCCIKLFLYWLGLILIIQ